MMRVAFVMMLVMGFGAQGALAASGETGAGRVVGEARATLEKVFAAKGAEAGPIADAWWSAAERVGAAVDRMASTLRARDVGFFTALGAGSRSLVELREIGRQLQGGGATKVGVAALSEAMGRLRASYGAEQIRFRRGGPLAPAEAGQERRLQLAAKQWAASLAALAAAARRQHDLATLAALARLNLALERIAAAGPSLGGYLSSLINSDVALGEWAAITQTAVPAEAPQLLEADAAAEEIATSSEIGFVFAADLSAGKTWTYLAADQREMAGEEASSLGQGEEAELAPFSEYVEAAPGSAEAPVATAQEGDPLAGAEITPAGTFLFHGNGASGAADMSAPTETGQAATAGQVSGPLEQEDIPADAADPDVVAILPPAVPVLDDEDLTRADLDPLEPPPPPLCRPHVAPEHLCPLHPRS